MFLLSPAITHSSRKKKLSWFYDLFSGEPSNDPRHPDYRPQLFSYRKTDTEKLKKDLVRYERNLQRETQKCDKENTDLAVSVLLGLQETGVSTSNYELETTNTESRDPETNVVIDLESAIARIQALEADNEALKTRLDDTTGHYNKLSEEYRHLKEERDNYKTECAKLSFGESIINDSDKKTNFYTGLQSYMLFTIVFDYVSGTISKSITKLSLKDELFIFLVKLRLNLCFEDIAYRAGVSHSTISRIFYKWLNASFVKLKFLINWPSREVVRETLPNMFKAHFPRTVCIIDCTEIFIDRPKRLKTRAQTFSNYKKHNTAKVLIGITPTGAFSFISSVWGGKVSDKEIVEKSGFLDKLMHGDQVLADRGFVNNEEFAVRGATLTVPAFTRGRRQLTAAEVETSRELAHVRIEVERLIGYLKTKFTILEGPVPVSLCKVTDDTEFASLDKILTVCGALTNLCEGIVDVDKS